MGDLICVIFTPSPFPLENTDTWGSKHSYISKKR